MDPMIPLLILHSFGLALGVGGATILDYLLLRSLRVPLEPTLVQAFTSISALVALALALLWVSGIGFLLVYRTADPGLLANPKLWAKITVVGVLTLNGACLHRYVLPLLRSQSGRLLFEGLPARVRIGMLTAGTVSVVSWYFPFLLGIVRQLNFAASFETFLAAYSFVLVLSWCVIQSIGFIVSARVATAQGPDAVSARTEVRPEMLSDAGNQAT